MNKLKTLLTLIVIVIFLSPASIATSPANSATSDDPASVIVNGIKDFKSLPRSERKARLKEVRKVMKEYRAEKRAGRESDDQILAIIFAILIPPLGVYLYEKKITTKFWISLLLTLLFWLPGAIYAILVVTGNA